MSDKKISQLTATTTPGSTDVMPIVQSSVTKKITFANLKAGILNSGSLTSGVIPYWNGTNLDNSWLSRETAGLILTTGKKIRTGTTGKTNIEFGAGGDEFWLTTDGGTEAESALYMSSTQAELGFGNYGAGLKLEAALTTLRNTTELRCAAPIIWLYDPNNTSVGEYYAAADEAGMYTDTNSILVSETAVAGSTNYIQVRNAKAEIKHGTRIDFASPIVNFNNLTASTVVYLDASKNLISLAAGTNGHVLTLSGGLPVWAAVSAGTGDLKSDGSVPMSADWAFGGYSLTGLKSFAISGAGGNGYGEFVAQASNVSAPGSTGLRIFAGSTGELSWARKNGSDTYVRAFASTLTADRTYTLPDYNMTFASLAGTETFTNKTLTSPTVGTSLTASYATASTIAIFDGSKNLISADTATYPSLTELSYVKGGTSSFQTQLNTKYSSYFYQCTSTSPADSTSYFFNSVAAVMATTAVRLFSFDGSETVKSVHMTLSQAGNGSNESVTLYLRNNTTGTDNAVGTFTSDFGANISKTFHFTGLSIAVNSTDDWVWKIAAPAFGTNPTSWNIGLQARTL